MIYRPFLSASAIPRRAVLPMLAVLLLTLIMGSQDASAGRAWCKADPVIKIDGKVADIYLSSYVDLKGTVTGPAKINVSIPRGSTAELLASDRGFDGYGYEVTFVIDGTLKKSGGNTQVRVQAYVPSTDGSLPLKVDFTPRSSGLQVASAQGFVNTYWVTLKTR